MGALLHETNSKLLGLYDELAIFLSQMNIFRVKGVADSHESAVFLQLYGANLWVHKTGILVSLPFTSKLPFLH